MSASVALLRAVNVGGRNRVPMGELRAALGAAGLEDVATILQSGNVLFRSAEPERITATLVSDVVESAFGLRVGVLVRSADELATIVGRNPFVLAGNERDPVTLHVAFLADHPDPAAVKALDPDRSPRDAFVVDGREVYLSYGNGSGRSRLTLDYLEKTLCVEGTVRNRRTVERLASAAGALR